MTVKQRQLFIILSYIGMFEAGVLTVLGISVMFTKLGLADLILAALILVTSLIIRELIRRK